MIKYSIVLVASLVLFAGCGGGGSDDSDTTLSTTSTQNISSIEQSLRDAGYTGVSDVIELGTDTIAFTYFNASNKHFVVYNNQEGRILSDIPSFSGDTVINNDTNSITFDNGTKVNVDNYTDAKVEVTQQYTDPVSQKTPKEMINDQLPSDQYISQFVYSPQKQAAVVSIKFYESGITKGVYLYGLDNTQPIREKVIYEPEESGENIATINFPQASEINFVVAQYGWKYYYTYNQWEKNLTMTKYVSPDGNTQSSNDTLSTKEIINNQLSGRDYVEKIVYAEPEDDGDYAAVIIASSGDIKYIYLYDMANKSNPRQRKLLYEADEEDISSMVPVGNNEIEFRVKSAYSDEQITLHLLTGEYHTEDLRDNSSSNISMSIDTQIQNVLSSDGISLEKYAYSQQRGGILAIGKSGGTIRFYRFDAVPIAYEQTFYMNNLPEYLKFYSITALSGGNFRITTNSNDIVFNYFTGDYTY